MDKTTLVTVISCVALLVMSSVAMAISMPTPISGRVVNSGYLGNIEVTITNLDSSRQDTLTINTNENGAFFLDWGNSGFTDISNGDRFQFTIGSYVTIIPFVDKIRESDGSIFNVTGLVTPIDKPCPVVTLICPDPVVCSNPIICPDPVVCPTCPEPSADQTVNYLVTLLAGLGVGVGLVYVKIGKTAQHMHKGITSYHSIYTSHSNKDIRHPRGMIAPKYMETNGKWKYIGD